MDVGVSAVLSTEKDDKEAPEKVVPVGNRTTMNPSPGTETPSEKETLTVIKVMAKFVDWETARLLTSEG